MVQVTLCSEEGSSVKKYQFLPTLAFWIRGHFHLDGLTAHGDCFEADFPDLGASFLFKGDLWHWWPDYFHY